MKTINRVALSLLILITACKRSDDPKITPVAGQVKISFSHTVNGVPLVKDSMLYINSRGQHYMVNDLQYFISGLEFHQCNAGWKKITTDAGIHYADIRIPGSETWELKDFLSAACYDSIRFIFGLTATDNLSNRFPDPPERDMFWPEMLGGGYHYMKMNLKWKNETMPQQMPFMFHLGIGQAYAGGIVNPDSVIGFIHNQFTLQLPCEFIPAPGKNGLIDLNMSVEKWFDGAASFDFSAYPMGIMQNQEGMFKAIQNGKKAFSARQL